MDKEGGGSGHAMLGRGMAIMVFWPAGEGAHMTPRACGKGEGSARSVMALSGCGGGGRVGGGRQQLRRAAVSGAKAHSQ